MKEIPSVSEILEVLETVRKDIETAKNDVARMEGALQNQYAQLKELGFDSLEEAEEELRRLEEDLAEKETMLEKEYAEFITKLNEIKEREKGKVD